MRRISLAIALIGAVAATGCGKTATSNDGGNRGVAENTFNVTVQNGQNGNFSLAINGGYVQSTPAGIDCGVAPHSVCSFDFPAASSVTLTATVTGAGVDFFGWAGDCSGSTCVLSGAADKYVLAQFGLAANQAGHPNWSQPAAHGTEFWDWQNGRTNIACTQCHGFNLQGLGMAPSCQACHGSNTKTVKLEGCNNCHSPGTYGSPPAVHAQKGVVTASASATTVAANTTDLEFTLNVKVDGVGNANMLVNTPTVYRFRQIAGTAPATVIANFERLTVAATTGYTIASLGSGDYKVTIVGGVALVGAEKTTFLVRLGDTAAVGGVYPDSTSWATVVTNYNGLARDLVGNQACVNCHAEQVFREREANGEWHHGANPYGAQACVVCHTRSTSVSRGMGGDRFTAYVHGIHNSHEMPARNITATVGGVSYTATKPDAVYARNDSLRVVTVSPPVAEISSPWSIGFPGYMVNCFNCHDTQARLDAIMARPVSHSTCFSCHDNWNGFPTFDTANAKYTAKLAANPNWAAITSEHKAIAQPVAGTAAANACAGCHNGVFTDARTLTPTVPIFDTVGEVHLTRITERAGLVYLGRDQSIAQGQRITMSIDSVSTATAGKLVVTWSAKLDGAAVNPCNATVSPTAPVFVGAVADAATGQVASNMSLLQAYAKGNDWVNPGAGTSPGQPPSAPTLTFTGTTATNGYTTCASNVATSYINVAPATTPKGVVALQGKPQLTFQDNTATPVFSRVIAVRSESPVREFVVADGTLPAAASQRRPVVSNAKCLACHAGSLYQHGGNRIDNVFLCIMCHNPAANEKNNRVGMGVDASEAYDGKPGQTYDLRYMIHAIHSAGETNAPLVYYRTNGIYAFGSQAAIDALPNWPGAGSFKPYGSGANEPARTHNEIVVHYPRHLNACDACHVNDSEKNFAIQDKQVAVTVYDSGATQAFNEAVPVYNGAVNSDLTDDVLMGAGAASCFSCHQSTGAQQQMLRDHGSGFGWTPQAFPAGRDTLINFAVCGAATCP